VHVSIPGLLGLAAGLLLLGATCAALLPKETAMDMEQSATGSGGESERERLTKVADKGGYNMGALSPVAGGDSAAEDPEGFLGDDIRKPAPGAAPKL